MSTSFSSALIELHYLPSIAFFSKLLAFEEVIIEQQEHYQKGSYRNRCHIAGANGLQVLSIPLEKGKHQKLPIREVRIAYTQAWHTQHWRSIRSAYANAPFYPYYCEPLQALFKQPPLSLFEFNKNLLSLLCQQLDVRTSIRYSSVYQLTTSNQVSDLRGQISPKNKAGSVTPNFHAVPYPQVFLERHGFLPNLSILDLIFCTGPQALSILQNCAQVQKQGMRNKE